VVTAYFIDQKGWSRKKATIQFGAVITIVGMFCSFSLGGGVNITEFLGISFFDAMDYLSSKYMLPLGGMFTAIFIIKKWGITEYMNELRSGMEVTILSDKLVKAFLTIAAAVVAFIILNEIYSEIFGKALIG
jgi:NSS family neurotransmitter:Na+ symporter